jgi:hypothetical protein
LQRVGPIHLAHHRRKEMHLQASAGRMNGRNDAARLRRTMAARA